MADTTGLIRHLAHAVHPTFMKTIASWPESGAGGKTFPHFQRKRAEEDEAELAADKEHQPFERRVGEAVAVQADAEHVHAEPRPARDDVADDGEVHEAAFAHEAAPARVQDGGVPENDEQRAVFLRVPYSCLGMLQFNASQWGPALENLRKTVALKCSEDDPRFYIWLIQVETGKEADANKELGAFVDSLQGLKAKEWPASIGRFLTGNLPESEFITLAGINTNRPSAVIEQVSEAYFYAGMKHKLAGDEQGAVILFQKCLDTGDDNNLGNWSARAQLRALKQH